MKQNQKNRRANTLLTLAALLVVLLSNVYVGRAQLELAWENTNYHYQSFNKYKKIITAEEGLVDMRTGNVIYKEQENHWILLTPDGSQVFDGEGNGHLEIINIYNIDTFEKLDTIHYSEIYDGLSLDGMLMDNKTAFYHAHIGEHYGLIFWDIYTKQRTDTILYVKTGNWLANATNYEYTRDGRYLSFQFSTMNPQTLENYGDYFIIMDLLKGERFYAKYIGEGFSRDFMNDKNIMIYPETIHDSVNKVDNYYLQFYDLDFRKVSKSIKMDAKTTGVILNEKNTVAILARSEGKRFFDLTQEKLSNFVYKPVYSPYGFFIWADDSLLYHRYAAFKIDWTVGVDNQINEIEEITIFPNPAGSFINLKLPNNINPKRWEIIDISGNVLLKNKSSISNDLRIDITQLAPEPYILRIYTDKTVLNYKIIKQ